MRRRVMALFTLLVLMAVTALPATAHQEQHEHDGAHNVDRQLAKLRISTVKFFWIENAERAGYQLGYIQPFPLNGCIAHPTDPTQGAMGYHWFNHDMIHDTELDPRRPEGLVYAPMSNGRLRLAAVEWIVPRDLWEAEGNTEPPELLGHELHILNPALGWYILHAWVWMYNPSGVFNDWNPRVDCD
jgi:hypothetical protein